VDAKPFIDSQVILNKINIVIINDRLRGGDLFD
jgi:hypothetical protein